MAKVYLSIVLFLGVLLSLQASGSYVSFWDFASVFFTQSITEADLRKTFEEASAGNAKMKILVVPGHDYESWGTSFRNVKEVELTTALGVYLRDFFKSDKEFEVVLARDEHGYHPALTARFNEPGKIEAFASEKIQIMRNLIRGGEVQEVNDVHHNRARPEVAQKLYSINQWANESKFHLVLHLHFNDAPGRRENTPGKYTGFGIYVPEGQYSNATVSRALAEPILARLARWYPVSNLPQENQGIIPDQSLIALGSNNTLDAAGLLIEYGYIYEPRLLHEELREAALKDLAYQTYLGIHDFFEEHPDKKETYFLPHVWTRDLFPNEKASPDVLALQAALTKEGFYPPKKKTKHDCPITGNLGPCTKQALKEFKASHGISEPSFLLGPKTRQKLNSL